MRIAGSVALVTGGSSGLGHATAGLLAAKGARVVAMDLDAPTQPHGDADQVVYCRGNVTRDDDVASCIRMAESTFGPVQILVNCAGGGGTPARLVGRDGTPVGLDLLQSVIDTNLVGTLNVTRLILPSMSRATTRNGERGIVVNVSSIAAFEGQAGQVAYAAAKGGINAVTLPLARELAPLRIRVATIAPGIFDTPRVAGFPDTTREAIIESAAHPQRLGRPDEFAALVCHVIENPMINGACVRLDGGLRLR